MARKKSDLDLSPAEVAFLQSKGTDPAHILGCRTTDVGLQTSAYRKLAMAAHAERTWLVEQRLLEVERGEHKTRAELAALASHTQEANRQLDQENVDLRRQLMAATAVPALAIHSRD